MEGLPCCSERKSSVPVLTVSMARCWKMGRFCAVKKAFAPWMTSAASSNMTPASESRPERRLWIFQSIAKKIILCKLENAAKIAFAAFLLIGSFLRIHLLSEWECPVPGLCVPWSRHFRLPQHNWSFWKQNRRLYRQTAQSSRWLPHG